MLRWGEGVQIQFFVFPSAIHYSSQHLLGVTPHAYVSEQILVAIGTVSEEGGVRLVALPAFIVPEHQRGQLLGRGNHFQS